EKNTSLSSFTPQLYDEPFLNPITRSNSPVSESRSITDNKTYNKPILKKTKLSRRDGSKNEARYENIL
ncbi:3912_t:CDS:1, partial [Racocetra persica]